MLSDDLSAILKSVKPDIETIAQYYKNARIDQELKELSKQSQTEDFWKQKDQATILKRLQALQTQSNSHHNIMKTQSELTELIELFHDDEKELGKLKEDVDQFVKDIAVHKISILLGDPQDNGACFLSVTPGAGGTESQDWAEMLLRMFLRFCERERLTVKVIDYQQGEEAGIKSATLYVKGKLAYGKLKGEHGVHRLVRISPYDASKRRHTSFAAIYVVPETPDIEIEIDQKDLRIDTYRASGAGGQHVNKTDSAVRITHIPTGIVAQCQNERSQLQNKETSMKILKARLAEKAKAEQESKLSGIEKRSIEWGSQIRSYVLHPYKMVKDHRTGQESHQPELTLDGELSAFIEAYLLLASKNKAQ